MMLRIITAHDIVIKEAKKTASALNTGLSMYLCGYTVYRSVNNMNGNAELLCLIFKIPKYMWIQSNRRKNRRKKDLRNDLKNDLSRRPLVSG